MKYTCKQCKSEFKAPPSKERIYCSRLCSNIGKPNHFHIGHTENIGSKNSQWKGGIYKNLGYVFIHSPKHPNCDVRGYVQEHRLVMEQHLGRYLNRNEVIHHINKIKHDNRIENLMLFQSNAEHLKYERQNK